MSEDRSNSFYSNLGPPNPIDYLRSPVLANVAEGAGSSTLLDDLRRFDSDDEGALFAATSSAESDEEDEEADGQYEDYGEEETSSEGEHVAEGDTKPPAVTGALKSPADRPRRKKSTRRKSKTAGEPKVQLKQDPPARERPEDGAAWPYRETLSFTRSLVFYGAGSITSESVRACRFIQKARSMRQKYFGGAGTSRTVSSEVLRDPSLQFKIGTDGVAELFLPGMEGQAVESIIKVPNIESFSRDYTKLVEMVSEGAMRSFCFQRLQLLSVSFKMHTTMNASVEGEEQSSLLGTDFYRTMKIDNHIHAAAAPTAKQFVEFVRGKLEMEPDTVVFEGEDGTGGKTLRQVYTDAGLDKDHLTIDAFSVLADHSVYQRFDTFNSKYSPFKLADMRRIFLKVDNHLGGRYFAGTQ